MKDKFIIFEHEALIVDERYDGVVFTAKHHALLERFFKEKSFPYYRLIRNGARFCEYVGVLQIGKMVIEVLPKADDKDESHWRGMLVNMLRAVGAFDIHAPSSSDLHIKSNSILDLYIELFIDETEDLVHRGLIKKYRKTESNNTALKGSLVFSKHIRQNFIHQERFYVRHTIYDQHHALNQILYKTIRLLKNINTARSLDSRIGALLLNFPEMEDIRVSESTFDKIVFNRKNQAYKKAMDIARLLLLNYHPDVLSGRNDVLALMFDMNLLWEQFVYRSLKKYNSKGYDIKPQSGKLFWKRNAGSGRKMIPDIIIDKGQDNWVVLDTKWKNIGDDNPSPEDLRQMYLYSKYHRNAKTALVYPGFQTDFTRGCFLDELTGEDTDAICGIATIKAGANIKSWQEEIATSLLNLSFGT